MTFFDIRGNNSHEEIQRNVCESLATAARWGTAKEINFSPSIARRLRGRRILGKTQIKISEGIKVIALIRKPLMSLSKYNREDGTTANELINPHLPTHYFWLTCVLS